MAKLVFDEFYGTLSFAQRAAYRKFNVSPSDHQQLIAHFGENSHAAITQYVKDHAPGGMYRAPIFGGF